MTGTATHAPFEVVTRSAAGSATAAAIAVEAGHTARNYAPAAELTG